MKFLLLLGILISGNAISAEQKIFNLTHLDKSNLNKHRIVIEKYLSDESKEKYKSSAGKLGLLRALLESNKFKASQTYELQSMGVIFGDVFVQNMGFKWVIVEDVHGRDFAIKLKNTSIILYPQTMISKRIEKGEKVDIFDVYNGMVSYINDLLKKQSRGGIK